MAAAGQVSHNPNFRIDDPKYYNQVGRLLLPNTPQQCTIHHIRDDSKEKWLAGTKQFYVAGLTEQFMKGYQRNLSITTSRGLSGLSEEGRERLNNAVNAEVNQLVDQLMAEIITHNRNFLNPLFVATKVDGQARIIKPAFTFKDEDFLPEINAKIEGYSPEEKQKRYLASQKHALETMLQKFHTAKQLSNERNGAAEAPQPQEDDGKQPSSRIENVVTHLRRMLSPAYQVEPMD